MLRRRQDALPSFQSYRRTSASRSEEINRATDRQIEIDELLRERSDVEGLVTLMLQGVQQDLSPAQQKRFRKQLYTLTQNRRDALNRLQTIYGRYIGQLTTLDLAERQQVRCRPGICRLYRRSAAVDPQHPTRQSIRGGETRSCAALAAHPKPLARTEPGSARTLGNNNRAGCCCCWAVACCC